MKSRILLAAPLVLVVAYLLGPSPSRPTYSTALPSLPKAPADLERMIDQHERSLPLKPDVEARIIWADTTRSITDIAIVYLHGFSGTWHDGSPAIEEVARRTGANLYLARLHGHGLNTAEPLIDYSPDSVYADAVRALAVGKRLGRKVVIVGTSTGCTLGLLLASRFPSDVHSVVNWSPNIRLRHPLSFLANNPWGLALTRLVVGGDYRATKMQNPERAKYWYMKYRIEGISQLQELLETSMTQETFAAIKQPVLTMCWYRDEATQDSIVSVDAIRTMHDQLASTRKRFLPLDADAHEIGYAPESKAVARVVEETVREVLNY
ncbi:MAG: alpha/beta fold hydrolase [Candidatus Kapabacteria bacterium]|nr:alpha/beta fold hydrolase [Candidatus Kapabacteria bacterium]